MKKSIVESKTTAKSKLELFVTKANCWKPLTFATKSSILDFAVVPDRSLKGTLLIILDSSSKTYFKSYRTKKLYLRLYSLSLVSHEKCIFQTMKNICLLFIFSMFFGYFVFEALIHQGIPNRLG